MTLQEFAREDKHGFLKEFRKLPGGLTCIPIGTRLLPACTVDPENKDGWIILPPENCDTEEKFQEWKDQLYNNAIDQGLKTSIK